MRIINYDKYPSTQIEGGITCGWNNINKILSKINNIITVDFYQGVYEDEIIKSFKNLRADLFIKTSDLFKSEAEIEEMTAPFTTNDPLFGYVSDLSLINYFDTEKLAKARSQIAASNGKTIVIGVGAALVAPDPTILIYADMARWEIQTRFRKQRITNIGLNNYTEPFSEQYKKGYFNDWRVCDKHKSEIFRKVDFWLDTHLENHPKMIDRTTFFKGIDATISKPFRVVPFFDPAPWGGQWMKQVFDLDKETKNYGWCFDCVPEENSLLFKIGNELFEIPSINLVLLKSTELLGESVESIFGKEFPIRFDFLDTMSGGNLSLQVHPTTQFIREQFGMKYTQDESYYILDALDDACVYLGVKEGIDSQEMIRDLEKAEKTGITFDTDKYVNKLPARKHDHFLIPEGTVHCSGANVLVLEISSTPNIFTFKMWDWKRMGLDGKPRPINIERAKKVIDWKKNTNFVIKNLYNQSQIIDKGDGWFVERTGLHDSQFIETHRYLFSSKVLHNTNGVVNVINLVDGEEAVIESPTNKFDPFVIHYAETVIIPASIGEYTTTPMQIDPGKEVALIKAFVRIKAQ